MNRRKFLRRIVQSVTGILALPLLAIKAEKQKPVITEGEIGPIESRFMRVWTEDGCKTIVKERKTFDGKIIIERNTLPEPAKMVHIYFGRIIAICENATYGEQTYKN